MLHFLFYAQPPHKNQMLQGYASKVERKRFQSLATAKPALSADGAKIAAARRACTQKIQRTPQVNSKRIMSCVALPTDAEASQRRAPERRRALLLCWIMRWAGNKRKGEVTRWAGKSRGCQSRSTVELHVWSLMRIQTQLVSLDKWQRKEGGLCWETLAIRYSNGGV